MISEGRFLKKKKKEKHLVLFLVDKEREFTRYTLHESIPARCDLLRVESQLSRQETCAAELQERRQLF